MAAKVRPSFTDSMVAALSPILIIGLIGSLVFFLVEILYAGRYQGALLWTLIFFVIGIVLVARIAIETDAGRARIYGSVLAGATFLALLKFVEYPDGGIYRFSPFINIMLIALIWWCAHKLTWDCTYIDEQRPVSGKGLLAAAGLEQRPETQGQTRDEDLKRETEKLERLPFLKRWERFRERRRKRPQQPGLTVVWFSLAALPIFGLGESLIPTDRPERRSYVFWLAAGYVGCALGLLVTTSFLGLRRYLRQRKMEMPGALTGVWLGLGGAIIMLFLVVGALLPRPYSESPVADLDRAKSKDREASRNAVVPHSSGEGNSNSGSQSTSKGGETSDGRTAGEKDGQGNNGRGETRNGQGGESKDGQSSSKERNGQGGTQSGQSKNGGGGAEKRGGQGPESKQGNAPADSSQAPRDGNEKTRGGDPKQSNDNAESSRSEQGLSNPATGSFLGMLLNFIKWLVFILLALLVLAFLVHVGLKYLANFMLGPRKLLAALSAWWENLWRKKWKKKDPLAPAPEKKPERRPFSSFSNPFADGTSEGRSTDELIGYSFAALEAWAADRNHGRRADETPLEFAARLSHSFASLHSDAQELAILVVRLAYANGKLPENARDILDRFWDRLTAPQAVAGMVATDA